MSAVDWATIESWRGAIGRATVQYHNLEPHSLRRYALALGLEGVEADPPLPHWAFFLPAPTDAELGEDGHPRKGGFLPAVTLPRRMFAASSMTFERSIETGAEGKLTSVVADVVHKTGRSGDLVFVEVDRELTQEGLVCVRERQSYVYRGDGGPVPMPVQNAHPSAGERWEPNEVNLFRFSAATFNGHRVHYDRPYATEVEGYPALVIHGPFTAARLAGLAMRRGRLKSFAFRAQAPLFLGQPVFLAQGDEDGEYRAVRCDGVTAMTAKVTW